MTSNIPEVTKILRAIRAISVRHGTGNKFEVEYGKKVDRIHRAFARHHNIAPYSAASIQESGAGEEAEELLLSLKTWFAEPGPRKWYGERILDALETGLPTNL